MTNMPGLNFQLGEDIDALRDAVRALPSVKNTAALAWAIWRT